MKLIEFMRAKGYTDEDFALLMGNSTTARAVKNWKYGDASPRLKDAAKIEELTKGHVRMADLIAKKDIETAE